MKTTWKITRIENGEPAGSLEGVSHENAVKAIHAAIHGGEVLADVRVAAPQEQQTPAEALAA